jgi:hypothetical protein
LKRTNRSSNLGARHEGPMQHLEEGIIHTWLDGEVSPEESASIEAHVKQCAECAAMVADARGLVAGAGRIVAALDVVPAGVIPKATSTAPGQSSAWRSLRLSPFRAALAASLMVAAASLFAVGRGPVDRNSPSMAATDSATAPTTPAAPMSDAAKAAAAAPASMRRVMASNAAAPKLQTANAPPPAAAPAPAEPSQPAGLRETRAREEATSRLAKLDSAAALPSATVAQAKAAAPPRVALDSISAASRIAVGASAAPRASAVTGGVAGGVARDSARRAPAMRPLQLNEVVVVTGLADMGMTGFEGCYRVLPDSLRPAGVPQRFALRRATIAGVSSNIVSPADSSGRIDSARVGTWRVSGNSLVLVSFAIGGTQQSLTFTPRVTDLTATTAADGVLRRLRVDRVDCR